MSTTTEASTHAEQVYYFGCLRDVGHHLHEPGGWRPGLRDRLPSDWPQAWDRHVGGLDGTLLDQRQQKQGLARLHHVKGWTALAFWDRSVDPRPSSNSVFVTRGTLGFSAMLTAARSAWPDVFARLTFDIVEDTDAVRA